MDELRFRQIHMDFHTSEKIKGIGSRFNAEKYAETLERASVNSVTCFAKCHHGMLYYNSPSFPELIHPGLVEKDLLKKQIDACHKRGIKVPVYTTVQWDYNASSNHPEWVCLTSDGSLLDFCTDDKPSKVYEAGFYKTLCVNSPYRSYLKAQVADFFEYLTPDRVDGVFLDIVNAVDCSCKHCMEGMKKKGYHPENKEERMQYARETMYDFKTDMSAYIRGLKEDVSIFYNAGHVGPEVVDAKDAYTHWELESLPSGFWGYSHFTNTVRYARTTGKDFLAQTGKFHTEWGDFHSFKNPEALQYECFRMLAYNSKCLIGDQLNPDGEISEAVYNLIGSVYREVEKKEPWCTKAKPLTEIGVVTDEFLKNHTGPGGNVSDGVNGACTMLDELGYQLDIIDNRSDFSKYKVIILPDTIWCSEELAMQLKAFVRQGGKILASGFSGLNREHTAFALDLFGAEVVGEAPYSPDFIMPNTTIGKRLPKTEHVMYEKGMQVKVVDGTVLMDTYIPYFNRTWEHFCSHKHTPSSHEKGYPAIVEKEENCYFMHPIFSIYYHKHPKWCKEVVKDILERILPNPIIQHGGPTSMLVTINEQVEKERYVVHALHYIPLKVSTDLYTIEDIIPIYHIPCKIQTAKVIHGIQLVPSMKKLQFTQQGEVVAFEIPEINGHAMVELNYGSEE